MKKNPTPLQLKRKIWKIIVAEHCFKRVAAMCAYVHKTQPQSESFRLLVSAIVVEYARPFCANSRSNGDLDGKYAVFSAPDLTDLHKKLVQARHDAYAHFSLERQGVYFKIVSDAGGFSIYNGLHEDDLNPDYIPKLERMAVELQQRLAVDGRHLTTELLKNETLVPGEYRLSLEDETILSPIKNGEFGWPEDFDSLRIPPDLG